MSHRLERDGEIEQFKFRQLMDKIEKLKDKVLK